MLSEGFGTSGTKCLSASILRNGNVGQCRISAIIPIPDHSNKLENSFMNEVINEEG
ncbi:MAG: hypothetical protein QXP36_10620 [Conexivisphaerales archaeon]